MNIPAAWFTLYLSNIQVAIWTSALAAVGLIWVAYRNPVVVPIAWLLTAALLQNALATVILLSDSPPVLYGSFGLADIALVVLAAVSAATYPELARRLNGRPSHRISLRIVAIMLVLCFAASLTITTLGSGQLSQPAVATLRVRLPSVLVHFLGGFFLLVRRPPAGVQRRVANLLAVGSLIVSTRLVVVLLAASGGITGSLPVQIVLNLGAMGIALTAASVMIAACVITERRRVEEESTRAQVAAAARDEEGIGRAAATLAHDFANVMQLVSFAAPALAVPAFERESRLLKEAADLARVRMKRLMNFARTKPATVGAIELGSMLERLQPLIAQLVTSHAVRISIPARPITVRGIAEALERAVVELVRNAVEWSPAGSEVKVSLRDTWLHTPMAGYETQLPPGEYACLEVSDQGSGLDPDDLPRLFDPRFTWRPQGNTGLGLSTARVAARAAGGDLLIDSTQIGRAHV